MIFLKYNETGKVNYTHYMPFHEKYGLGKTKEELEQEGVLVDSIPESKQIEGKAPILYCNPSTKELWYEYEDIPKTQEEIQQKKISQLESALLEMTTLNAIQQAQNEQAILELTMMIGGM